MSVDVMTIRVIPLPRDVVSAYAADPSNAPQWYANIESVEWKTPPPLQVGSQVAFVARFLGRRMTYTYEVVEFIAGERLIMRTSQGPFPMETRYTWADTNVGTTLMTLRNCGEPVGFSKVAAPFMAHAIGKANRKDIAALEAILVAG